MRSCLQSGRHSINPRGSILADGEADAKSSSFPGLIAVHTGRLPLLGQQAPDLPGSYIRPFSSSFPRLSDTTSPTLRDGDMDALSTRITSALCTLRCSVDALIGDAKTPYLHDVGSLFWSNDKFPKT